MNRMIPAGWDGKDKRDGCPDEIRYACHGHEFHGVKMSSCGTDGWMNSPGEIRYAVVNEFHRAGRSEGRKSRRLEGKKVRRLKSRMIAPVKYASLSFGI